ncbi:MAG: hypothetical protein M3069_22440 [Chloroflexota bacterium]|nr:hypothetical protein [Chloroflexota bacterium]
MPTLRQTLSLSEQLALAVRCQTPVRLASTFASLEGQFYDRAPFDNLARQVHALYEPTEADVFHTRLDRRLRDRHSAPVDWTVQPATTAVRRHAA